MSAEADAATVREALVRPYREIKDPSFFAIDELPEFEALDRLAATARDAEQRYRTAISEIEQAALKAFRSPDDRLPCLTYIVYQARVALSPQPTEPQAGCATTQEPA